VDQIGPFTQVATSVGHTIALGPMVRSAVGVLTTLAKVGTASGVNYTADHGRSITTNCAIKQNTWPSAGEATSFGQSSPVAGGYLQVRRGPPAHVRAQGRRHAGLLGYNFYGQVDDVPGGAFVQVASGSRAMPARSRRTTGCSAGVGTIISRRSHRTWAARA